MGGMKPNKKQPLRCGTQKGSGSPEGQCLGDTKTHTFVESHRREH